MKIAVDGWDSGVKFRITTENPTETALLTACIDTEGVLGSGEEDNEFELTLPVCND